MLQKNDRTLNQNRVFGWIAHWYPSLTGSGFETEIVALLDECRGLQRLPSAPDIETARAMRAQWYAIAERIFDKHGIERNRRPALENLKSMMRKCNRFFNCDDPEVYRASVNHRTKVPRHGAPKVVQEDLRGNSPSKNLGKRSRPADRTDGNKEQIRIAKHRETVVGLKFRPGCNR